ncbi:MAG: lysophospholipid acyltransferase family protein [Armatimonadota bacterium]
MARNSKKLEKLVGTGLMKLFGAVAYRVHDEDVALLGQSLGRLIWKISRRYRQVALKNLTFVYEHEKTPEEIEALARRVFEHFGQVAVEFFWLRRKTHQQILALIDMPDEHKLNDLYAKGKGVIIISAHFGNWEAMGLRLVASGHRCAVVARDCDDPTQAEHINRVRRQGGFGTISKQEPASRMFEILARNELLGILPDQNTVDKPVFVPFFGKLASAAPGVSLLALRAGAPVIPGFAVRHKGRFHVELYPPIEIPTQGDLTQRIAQITADYTSVIEQQIRKYPEQWLWFHDRWRRQPEPGELPE